MVISHTERFGKVVLNQIECDYGSRPVYSDGKEEQQLLDQLLQRLDAPAGVDWIQEDTRRGFLFQYHLSPIRHNLLKWFPFDAAGSLLDIGCGCGALTGLFAEKVARVTALEYSLRRARIAALRHKTLPNLEVFVGGLQDFAPKERYSYISVIGVLEYAPKFFGGPEPQTRFLRRAAELLEPGGALLIAIENKIGLKYLAGAPEDHTGIVFDSLYDYPHSSGVRTFSRKELSDLLHSAGFTSLDWFYPFPDYKFPRIVFSDAVAPQDSDRVWRALGNGTNLRHREVMSEKLLGRTLARAGLFHEFANSFLVVARRQAGAPSSVRCLKFSACEARRKPQFQLDCMVLERDGQPMLLKRPARAEAQPFLRVIQGREQRAAAYFGPAANVVCGTPESDAIEYPFLPHQTLEELIAQRLRMGAATGAEAMIREYCRFVRGLPSSSVCPDRLFNEFKIPSGGEGRAFTCLNAGPIDLIPANILVAPDCWHVVDSEWFFDFPVPVDFVLYRGIASLVTNLQDLIQSNPRENPLVLLEGHGKNRTYVPWTWLKMFDAGEVPVRTMSYWNWCFQAEVLQTDAPHRTRLRSNPRVLHDITPLSTKLAASLRWHTQELELRGQRFLSDMKRALNKILLRFSR